MRRFVPHLEPATWRKLEPREPDPRAGRSPRPSATVLRRNGPCRTLEGDRMPTGWSPRAPRGWVEQCDQAMPVEGNRRMRCLLETSFVVQRVRIPPGQGRAHPAGSEPCDGCGNAAGEAQERERVGRGVGGPEVYPIADAEGAVLLEGDEGLSVIRARAGFCPAGCTTTARMQEDLLRWQRGRPPARETVAAADGDEGVGGLHGSVDVGERCCTRTRPSEADPC